MQDSESSIELRFSGTKHCQLQMMANNPDFPQPGAPGAVEEEARQRFRELLAKDQFVRDTSAEIANLETSRKPHQDAMTDARAKLETIAAARKDPKTLQSADLGKKLADLDRQEGVAKKIFEEAAPAIKLIDGQLTTLRQYLADARQKLAAQAVAEIRQAIAADRVKGDEKLLAAMAEPLGKLVEIEARRLALDDAGLATRILAG